MRCWERLAEQPVKFRKRVYETIRIHGTHGFTVVVAIGDQDDRATRGTCGTRVVA